MGSTPDCLGVAAVKKITILGSEPFYGDKQVLWEPWQAAQKGFLDKSPVSSKPKGNTEGMTWAKAWMQDRTVFSRSDVQRGKPPSSPQDSRPVGALYVPDHKASCVSCVKKTSLLQPE